MTNPTISAEERSKRAVGLWKDARGIDNVIPWEDNLLANAAEQIRQAEQAKEQAAYERAARFAEKAGYGAWLAVEIRALAQQPEEVG